jgi:serine/threonine protein kinase
MADTDRYGGTRREAFPAADGGTRREALPGTDDGTRREGTVGANGGTRLEGGHENGRSRTGAGRFTRGLPPELSERFRVVEEMAAGAEADVVVVEETGSGTPFVIKLYRRGIAPDEEAVGRLAAADPAHVVQVVDRGWAGGCWFEVLEYCRYGSLRTLMTDGPLPSIIDVVRETGSALWHVHGLGLVHRDLKPENILIRTVTPLDVVLGDFGLVRTLDASVRWTRAWGTPAYSPPEFEGGEVSAGWDWWSLGMIVAELAGGRRPFQLPDGSMMSDQQIRAALAQRAVDLSAVSDSRARLLCQGLLTRDRRHRWGYEQVTEWLAGRSPQIVADVAAETPSRPRRVLFAGQEFGSPPELARGLQQHWADGIRKLYQERDATLVDELERLLRYHHLDEALMLVAPSSRANELPRRYANLLAEMDPELEPVYNGLRLTPAGLEAAAVDVIRSGGDDPAAKILDEVRRLDIMTSWRDLPSMEHSPRIQQQWGAANSELEAQAGVLGRHGYQPTAADWGYARAWLLLCILEPSHRNELASLIAGLDSKSAEKQQWWRDLRHAPQPTPVSLVLARLTQPLATEQTQRQDEAERARQRAEQQRRADAEAERRRQRRAERDRHAARRRRMDKTLVAWAIALIVTFGAPYGLGKWWSKHLSHPLVPAPPDVRALPTGTSFVPEWIFGGLVILGLLGLILLRPPWTGRIPSVFAGLVLTAAGLAAPWGANTALTDFHRAAHTRYTQGPIPVSALNGTCDEYWTSHDLVGSAYMRWVLTDSNNGGCTTLAAYHGWREAWHIRLNSNSWWTNLHMYGNIAVAEKDIGGQPNVLEAFKGSNGRLLWVFSCRDGDSSYLSDTSYGSSVITVTCARGQVDVNPRTGRQTS